MLARPPYHQSNESTKWRTPASLWFLVILLLLPCGSVLAATSYGYGGESVDSTTGLSYNRSRLYDSDTGTFISKDVSGVQGGLNSYLYANDNPIGEVDPLGLDGWDIENGYTLGVTNSLIGTINSVALISSGPAGQLLNDVGYFPSIPKLPPVGTVNQDFINGYNGGSFFFNVDGVVLGAGSGAIALTKLATASTVVGTAALPTLTIDAAKYPELADNILNAQQAGHPSVLTYLGDPAQAAANRAAAIQDVPNISGLSRDEYPFASTACRYMPHP